MIIGGFRIQDLIQRFTNQEKKQSYYLTICCIVKDENEYLKEWMNYHIKIGIEHFYIYDNESKIAVSETLKMLGLENYATVIKIYGKAKQVTAYNDCLKRRSAFSQWIGFIDADEFIVPKSTSGDLPGFLKDFENVGGLGINWLVFGSSGYIKRTLRSQLRSFLKRSQASFPINRHVKLIVQPRFVKRSIGAHLFSYKKGHFAVNEHFSQITSSYSDTSVDKIQINHYYCRSLEEYQDKVERGLADTSKRTRKMEDFHNHDREANAVEDRAILEILNRVE
ncbi:glycosyltransferase family 92 protein [Dyadobacter sp. CY345]|uniref:glycosyltransferase family 92 protein n=1 Tax=Dyadobacter sp. CY345 TaxID=2909335 RepID=UPI001F312437|nr:glycosyltransferase family 92 protein [Dyadobacter sp. CY345]MCF2447702.1 glycosyltransferase family 92 protein [Dyadobacter sp. CY345]